MKEPAAVAGHAIQHEPRNYTVITASADKESDPGRSPNGTHSYPSYRTDHHKRTLSASHSPATLGCSHASLACVITKGDFGLLLELLILVDTPRHLIAIFGKSSLFLIARLLKHRAVEKSAPAFREQ
jgi:hypothetical protein